MERRVAGRDLREHQWLAAEDINGAGDPLLERRGRAFAGGMRAGGGQTQQNRRNTDRNETFAHRPGPPVETVFGHQIRALRNTPGRNVRRGRSLCPRLQNLRLVSVPSARHRPPSYRPTHRPRRPNTAKQRRGRYPPAGPCACREAAPPAHRSSPHPGPDGPASSAYR